MNLPAGLRFLPIDHPADEHGNVFRADGLDRCSCGCKYWEDDRCIDCGGTEPEDG